MRGLGAAPTTTDTPQNVIRSLGAWAGIVGPILFTVVYTLDGLFQHGYSAIAQPVSYLAVAENGWIQIANFIVLGLLLILFALSFAQGMRPLIAHPWLRISTVLLILAGAGFLNDSVFSAAAAGESPAALHVVLHTIGFEVIFSSLALTCIVVGARLRKTPGWRSYGWYSIITGMVTLFPVFLALVTPAFSTGAEPLALGGLFQRIFVTLALAWYVVTGFRLLPARRKGP